MGEMSYMHVYVGSSRTCGQYKGFTAHNKMFPIFACALRICLIVTIKIVHHECNGRIAGNNFPLRCRHNIVISKT